MKFVITSMIALLALAAACGGAAAPGVTPAPTEQSIDPNLLTTVVLQASDLPPGYVPDAAFSPPGGEAMSFGTAFRLDGVAITSTVVQYADVPARDQKIDTLRRGLARTVGPETTQRLPGADVAYQYGGAGPVVGQASLTLRGRYVLSVMLVTIDPAKSAVVTDRAELQRYTSLVLDRLQTLLADPSSITPIAGAPTFDPGQPPPAIITETAVP